MSSIEQDSRFKGPINWIGAIMEVMGADEKEAQPRHCSVYSQIRGKIARDQEGILTGGKRSGT